MLEKPAAILVACIALAACAEGQPRIIQASPANPQVTVTVGFATQIEMPEGRVVSITTGNPALVTAEQAGDVVNLTAKGEAGETNLIIRALDDGGNSRVYQYHITVQKQ